MRPNFDISVIRTFEIQQAILKGFLKTETVEHISSIHDNSNCPPTTATQWQEYSRLRKRRRESKKVIDDGIKRMKSARSRALDGDIRYEEALHEEMEAEIAGLEGKRNRLLTQKARMVKKNFETEGFCCCGGEFSYDDEMFECTGNHCPGGNWYHPSCLHLQTVPTEEFWYCPRCRR